MRRLPLLLGLLVAILLVAWLLFRPAARQHHAVARQLTKAADAETDHHGHAHTAAETAKAFPLNSPRSDARADLRLIVETLDTFRTNFPQDGNPVGTNAEITAALTGKNKVRFAFIPPNHPAINRDGELCDRWGTPFFFHAESSTRMEVRSAGPDRKLHTEDDLVLSP